MSKTEMNDFLLVINQNNVITSIFPSDSNFSDLQDMKIETIFSQESLNQFNDFMKKMNANQSAFHHHLIIEHANHTHDCYLNGFKDGETRLIFVLFNTTTDEEILKKIMRLNSQQLNELRMMKKDLQIQDTKIYEEISKLNSELLNSKRTIEKQNAELQRYNLLLKHMSMEDSLTGSYNRRYFYDYMKEKILSSQKFVFHSLTMIDFNDFKKVNDQFGHDAGDRLLIMFVKMTKDIIKGKGEIFRIGGDEFIIIQTDTNLDESFSRMKLISNTFSSNSAIASISYGIVLFNESELNHEFDLTNLVNKADELMYIEKKHSKKL